MLEFSGQLTTPDRFSYHTGRQPRFVLSRCPVTESPPRSLPPETLFRYRFSPWRICFRIDSPPGDYILKQSLRGERLLPPPSKNTLPGEDFFSPRVWL